MQWARMILSALAAGAVMQFAACGGGDETQLPAAPPPPAATSSGCFDPAEHVTSRTVDAQYAHSGTLAGTTAVTQVVAGPVPGYAPTTTAIVSSASGSLTAAGGSAVDMRSTTTVIVTPESADRVLIVARSVEAPAAVGIDRTLLRYDPPYADARYALAEGASATEVQQGTQTVHYGGPGSMTSGTSFTTRRVVKYAGRETLTLPGGTWNTCRFDITTEGAPHVREEWLVVGRGVLVQAIEGAQVLRATSVSVNGQRL